ncbi:MAG: TlpA family protein disulfide reductase [Acidobacteria bacterium]|nr:TlpA family protein disulfide reductase [Acidobacteriota bacterium]
MRLTLFALCLTLAACSGSTKPVPAPEAAAPPASGVGASNDIGFAPVSPIRSDEVNHTDAHVDGLIATLTTLVSKQADATKWQKDAEIHFWRLQNRLERGRLSADQESRVVTAIDEMAAARPDAKAYLDHRKWMVQHLAVGKAAPEIVGKDFDDAEFTLSETLGKVTLVVFTGEWCGPCRSEYPYQRLMLELYKDKPFAIVGINSDAKLDVARKGKVDSRLPYRSWWDGYAAKNTDGPIATAWGVIGWPTMYLLDKEGVIRFAGLRHEDLLKAVSQLMAEKATE